MQDPTLPKRHIITGQLEAYQHSNCAMQLHISGVQMCIYQHTSSSGSNAVCTRDMQRADTDKDQNTPHTRQIPCTECGSPGRPAHLLSYTQAIPGRAHH